MAVGQGTFLLEQKIYRFGSDPYSILDFTTDGYECFNRLSLNHARRGTPYIQMIGMINPMF